MSKVDGVVVAKSCGDEGEEMVVRVKRGDPNSQAVLSLTRVLPFC